MVDNVVASSAGDLFHRKFAGIPFPVILLGVAGVAYGVRKMTKGKQDAAAAASSGPATEGYAMDVSGNKFASAYTGEAGGTPFGSGVGNYTTNSNNTPVTPETEMDNTGWARRVAEKLQKANMWDPILVQNALTKYTSGRTLDQREQAIINQGIKLEGQPIYTPDNTTSLPAEPAPPKTTPTSVAKGVAQITYFVQDNGSKRIWARYSDGRWVASNDAGETTRMRQQLPDWKAKTAILAPNDPVIVGLKKTNPLTKDFYLNHNT